MLLRSSHSADFKWCRWWHLVGQHFQHAAELQHVHLPDSQNGVEKDLTAILLQHDLACLNGGWAEIGPSHPPQGECFLEVRIQLISNGADGCTSLANIFSMQQSCSTYTYQIARMEWKKTSQPSCFNMYIIHIYMVSARE